MSSTTPARAGCAASSGVDLLLAAILAGVSAPFAYAALESWIFRMVYRRGLSPWFYVDLLPWFGLDIAAGLLLLGAIMLTAREGYPPADQADARLRRLVRVFAGAPLLALLLLHFQTVLNSYLPMNFWDRETWQAAEVAALVIATVGCLPLPLLIFLTLRGPAKRARSAHLAEHCLIVGIGASLALSYASIAALLLYNGDRWFGDHWNSRSDWALGLMLVLFTSALLFALWSLYLLVRFALAFGRAGRELRRKWRMDDRAKVAISA